MQGPRARPRSWRAAAAALLLAVAAVGLFAWHRHVAVDADGVQSRLAWLAAHQGAWDNPWDQQSAKIADLRASLKAASDPVRQMVLQREIAQQYLNAGAAEPAIALLEELGRKYAGVAAPQDLATLRGDLAFAYYRLGEQNNCATGIDSSTCLLPPKEGGIHHEPFGAQEAARLYGMLVDDPAVLPDDRVLCRWMLNLCFMQLGGYPEQVPKAWLIPPSAFASDHDIGRFKEVAASRGLVEFGRAGGAILEDFDNDGHLDLLISHMGVDDQMQYFHNDGTGHFVRATEKAGLTGLLGGLNMAQADYDNDGCIDVYIPRGAWYHDNGRIPGSLLHNNCDGTFTDVTLKAGVANGFPSQAVAWADFNNDGLLDLFVGNEIVRDKVPWPSNTPSFRLYMNQGGGKFVDVAAQTGVALDGMIKGVTVDDYDNDGRPDLYVSVMGGDNYLLHNDGGAVPRFTDVTARAGVAAPSMSFTTWFFDFDDDGWPDIFVSGYSATVPNIVREMLGQRDKAVGERARLYRNNQDGTFTDVSAKVGLDRLLLSMGGNFGDLDNDGWLDIYLGTGAAPLHNVVPNRMFRNDGGRRFQDVTISGGFGHLQKGHAVAFGDVDNDGQVDVFENIGGAMVGDKFYSVLFKNPGHAGHWLKLALQGTTSNRFGVGARIRVRTVDAQGRPRDIHRTVGSGGSFGASSLRMQIGVGPATTVSEIEVRWPGGKMQRFDGPIAVDRSHVARQAEPALATASRP